MKTTKMKTIKLLTLVLLTSSTLTFGQEDDKSFSSRTSFLIRPKLGFSTLDLDDKGKLDGFVTQLDLCYNSNLGKKLSLEYGIGVSRFTANSNTNSTNLEYNQIKNQYLRILTTLNYMLKHSETFSTIIGFGCYGSYLYESNIPPYIDEEDQGFALGLSISIGTEIKFNKINGLRIQIESQRDLSEFKKNNFSQKLTDTNLISLTFFHNF